MLAHPKDLSRRTVHSYHENTIVITYSYPCDATFGVIETVFRLEKDELALR